MRWQIFFMLLDLRRILNLSLFDKITIMPHLAADYGFATITDRLAVYGSIAIDKRLYIVCAKVEVKLYTV